MLTDRLTGALVDPLRAVFEPRRIALVGASDRPGSAGKLFADNLSGFPGEVIPVGRSAGAVASLRDIGGPVDLAVVVVPAAAAPAVIAEAAAVGVPAAVVISGGFAEAGPEGAALQAELLAAAAGRVRIIGPNCFGVQNCDLGLNASLARGLPGMPGHISLVTQSGAYGMAVHTVALDEGARFAKVCATGNKADIGDEELLRYLGADPVTRVVCFLSESMADGRAFVDAARAITPDKPVIVARTGRSAAGARAAFSHTATLAAPHRVVRAALEQAGVLVVDSGLDMLDAARALDAQPPPAGARAAIVTNSGGTGVELADLLADEGVAVPELSAGLASELRELLPPLGSARNPVDLTTVWSRFAELYPAAVDRLARSGEVDLVIAVLLHRSADPAVAAALAEAVGKLRADGVSTPVYVCWVAERARRAGVEPLREAGVPCFDWPGRTARAVGNAVRYGLARNRVRSTPRAPAPGMSTSGLPDGVLSAEAGAHLLATAGIEVAPFEVGRNVEEAVAAAERIGYPVVAKALHPALIHKSDAGGVRLALTDAPEVAAAAADLLDLAPGARLLVQRQLGGTELVVGGMRDPSFGPMVLVGVGGVFVEILDDVVLATAPVSDTEIRDLLPRLRGYQLLTGARGRPAVGLSALATLVVRVGDLMVANPGIAELDLNPVLCGPAGCVVADWRVRTENRSSRDRTGRSDSPAHGGETEVTSP